MATNFPASLDTLTNPTSSDSLSSPSHSAQHANVNDAVEALQAKVGADSSAVVSSHDYKIAQRKILQVVSTDLTGLFSTTSTSYTDITGLSVSITPSSASSKVLIVANINHSLSGDNASYFQLVRDSTAIFIGDVRGSRQQVTFANLPGQYSPVQMMTASPIYLDSPNTTSATTYKFQAKVNSASYTLRVNADGIDSDNTVRITSASSITVMEVSA